jgi:hypothetical protein
MHFNPLTPDNDPVNPFFHPLNEEIKTIDKKKAKDIYDKLKKGSEVEVDFGNSMTRGGKPITLKVTSGHRVVGASKVGRIILVDKENPRGMKYKLFDRDGSVSLAQSDMGTILRDMKIVKEGVEELDEMYGTKIKVVVKGDENVYERMTRALSYARLPGYEGATFSKPKGLTTYAFDAKKHTAAVRKKFAKIIQTHNGDFVQSIEEAKTPFSQKISSAQDKLRKAGIKSAFQFGEVYVENKDLKRAEKLVGSDKDVIVVGVPFLRKDEIDEGFASDAQRRAAFASGYEAKGKKKKKEEGEAVPPENTPLGRFGEITGLNYVPDVIADRLGGDPMAILAARREAGTHAPPNLDSLNISTDGHGIKRPFPDPDFPMNPSDRRYLARAEEEFTQSQLGRLKKEYDKINKINPESPTYKQLKDRIRDMDTKMLQQIYKANIKFMRGLAFNELSRRGKQPKV